MGEMDKKAHLCSAKFAPKGRLKWINELLKNNKEI